MSELVITIGRENGSGGREVGRKLSEMLGIPCYDSRIISETAMESGLTEKDVRDREERNDNGLISYWGIPSANPLFITQSGIISKLAAEGSCIFIGRCADHVLNGRDNVVKVFIHAPLGNRILRSSERNNISEREAYDRIRKNDSERASYYQRYTGKIWGAVGNYDLTVNTGPIGTDGAAELIAEFIKKRRTYSSD